MANKTRRYVSFFIIIIFFGGCTWGVRVGTINKKQEAGVLSRLAKKYYEAKKAENFDTLYTLQSPEYCSVISPETFKANKGNVVLNTAQTDTDNSTARRYVVTPPPAPIRDYRLKDIYIDMNGKYAKTVMMIPKKVMIPGIPPSFVDMPVESIDYWERINGKWYILSHKRTDPEVHISGSVSRKPDKKNLLPEQRAEYKLELSRKNW